MYINQNNQDWIIQNDRNTDLKSYLTRFLPISESLFLNSTYILWMICHFVFILNMIKLDFDISYDPNEEAVDVFMTLKMTDK